LADAIIPVLTLVVLIAGAVILLFGLDALDGPVQVALVLSAMVVALILLKNGYSWDDIAKVARSAVTLLEEFKLLSRLIDPLLERTKTTGNLIAAVVATALGLNFIAADQYIALVLPVRLFRVEFEKRGLKAQNLSRACADAGTVTSPLVPWNSCGAFRAATLGIPTALYLPFCIFNINITAPIMSLLLRVHRLQDRAHQASGRAGTRRIQSLDNQARFWG